MSGVEPGQQPRSGPGPLSVTSHDVARLAGVSQATVSRALRPGTRIVVNSFGIPDWKPEATEVLTENCTSWCTAMLYRVPPQ